MDADVKGTSLPLNQTKFTNQLMDMNMGKYGYK